LKTFGLLLIASGFYRLVENPVTAGVIVPSGLKPRTHRNIWKTIKDKNQFIYITSRAMRPFIPPPIFVDPF
jgi:hypothetical protein